MQNNARTSTRRTRRIAVIAIALSLASLRCTSEATAQPVQVRYAEGMVHGFLVLRDVRDSIIAHGDLLQTARGSAIDSRMIFRFRDGSVLDERVTFTQKGVFVMQEYSLITKGPTFPSDTDIRLAGGTGNYSVRSVSRDGRRTVADSGRLDLPSDTYNGMVITLAKNLTKAGKTRVHFVAFMPKPKLVQLDLIPAGTQKIAFGSSSRSALHFVMRPQLASIVEFLAKLTGKMPADNHAWIMTDYIPAFVRFEGALLINGPVWRIELATPRWPG